MAAEDGSWVERRSGERPAVTLAELAAFAVGCERNPARSGAHIRRSARASVAKLPGGWGLGMAGHSRDDAAPRSVIVTRAREQIEPLARRLEELGHEVVRCPLIELEAIEP